MTDRAAPTVPALEAAFDVVVHVGAVDDYGATRAGHRRVISITGGRITGSITGEILPGGADWQLVRPDGTLEIDGRYSARTDTGDLLYLQVAGVRSGEPAVLESLLRGEPVDPSAYYFRTAVTVETSAPHLADLQRSVFVASCIRDADAVRYTAYRVT
ncbi:UPF0311 protein [Agromyces luteolus]|uniref:UPF0311 protein GLX25_03295 n=1 Tax=Agromyces luteolus TaxID=88373 RepID=A0A7C9HIQ4_9MICO|nr:DUF3237 domain-containing protein [Agromyces luteolus]MUN06142.1 DUF3237 family protein [Agromyces luteolus]GLK28817.1 UPF0311 protein [Agromyces luteolus]